MKKFISPAIETLIHTGFQSLSQQLSEQQKRLFENYTKQLETDMTIGSYLLSEKWDELVELLKADKQKLIEQDKTIKEQSTLITTQATQISTLQSEITTLKADQQQILHHLQMLVQLANLKN